MDVTPAKFRDVTSLDKDWLEGVRIFKCDATAAEDLEVFIYKAFCDDTGQLETCLAVQWIANERLFRGIFNVGVTCEVDSAEVEHAKGVVTVTIPLKFECIPRESPLCPIAS